MSAGNFHEVEFSDPFQAYEIAALQGEIRQLKAEAELLRAQIDPSSQIGRAIEGIAADAEEYRAHLKQSEYINSQLVQSNNQLKKDLETQLREAEDQKAKIEMLEAELREAGKRNAVLVSDNIALQENAYEMIRKIEEENLRLIEKADKADHNAAEIKKLQEKLRKLQDENTQIVNEHTAQTEDLQAKLRKAEDENSHIQDYARQIEDLQAKLGDVTYENFQLHNKIKVVKFENALNQWTHSHITGLKKDLEIAKAERDAALKELEAKVQIEDTLIEEPQISDPEIAAPQIAKFVLEILQAQLGEKSDDQEQSDYNKLIEEGAVSLGQQIYAKFFNIANRKAILQNEQFKAAMEIAREDRARANKSEDEKRKVEELAEAKIEAEVKKIKAQAENELNIAKSNAQIKMNSHIESLTTHANKIRQDAENQAKNDQLEVARAESESRALINLLISERAKNAATIAKIEAEARDALANAAAAKEEAEAKAHAAIDQLAAERAKMAETIAKMEAATQAAIAKPADIITQVEPEVPAEDNKAEVERKDPLKMAAIQSQLEAAILQREALIKALVPCDKNEDLKQSRTEQNVELMKALQGKGGKANAKPELAHIGKLTPKLAQFTNEREMQLIKSLSNDPLEYMPEYKQIVNLSIMIDSLRCHLATYKDGVDLGGVVDVYESHDFGRQN